MLERLREVRHDFVDELRLYRQVLAHERTPRIARVCLAAAIAYAVSPVDLIPDWIPALGYLDDLIVVPGLVWLGLRFVPDHVIAECRRRIAADGGEERGGRSG